MINPLFICGLPSSGKSILTMLFDGHSDIFGLSYLHDGVGNRLLYLKIPDKKRNYSIYIDKKHIVAKHVLKNIESISFISAYLDILSYESTVNYSVYRDNDKRTTLHFGYDSKIFKHSLIKNLEYFSNDFDLNLIWDAYASALRSGSSMAGQKIPVYCYSMLDNDFFRFNLLHKHYNNIRMIYINRDPEIVLPIYYMSLAKEIGIPFCEILRDSRNNGEMKRYIKSQLCGKEYAETYQDSMYIVQFNDLICNTENVMRNIAFWLSIPFSDTLLKPSIMGQVNPHCVLGRIADIEIYKTIPQEDLDAFLTVFNQEKELAEAELLKD